MIETWQDIFRANGLTLVLPLSGLSLLPRSSRSRLELLLSLRSLPLRRGAGDGDFVGDRRRRTGEGDRE